MLSVQLCTRVTLLLTIAAAVRFLQVNSADDRVCELSSHDGAAIERTCITPVSEGELSGPSDAIKASAEALNRQKRDQQLLFQVLTSIANGTISASAALELLRDVGTLRTSLQSGAAARRWAKLQDAYKQRKEPTQGILIVAGGKDQFINSYILVQLLRHHRIACNLPVEIVYYGQHEYHTPAADAMLAHGQATNTVISFIDGSTVPATDLHPHRLVTQIKGFRTKVHALVYVTSFDWVLLLDSDNTPLADPTYLLQSATFQTLGNIIWPDFWTDQWMKPVIYSVLGLDVPWETDPKFRASEAGQVVINRVLHYDVLEYLYLLNLHSSSGVGGAADGIVGKCLWGDKDTYLLAFSLAGKAHLWNSIQHMPMQAVSKPSSRYLHAGMVQRGLQGELLFLHRTAAGKLWPHCAVHGGSTCKVYGITTPVNQQQLAASVRDVTMMEFGESAVDLLWQRQHCGDHYASFTAPNRGGDMSHTESSIADGNSDQLQASLTELGGPAVEARDEFLDDMAVAGKDGNENGVGSSDAANSVQHQSSTVLACDLRSSLDRLPIPVVVLHRLPQQVQTMIAETYKLFLESLQL